MTTEAPHPHVIVKMQRPLAKVILLTRDEYDLIEDWVDFYSTLFDPENIIIVDNGSTNSVVLEAYDRFKKMGIDVRVDDSPFRTATSFMTKHMLDVANSPDAPIFILPLETDEFIYIADADKQSTTALTREAVLSALRAVPEDANIIRYASFMGSIVKYDDPNPGYKDAFGYTRPARQMTRFFDQGWDKLIVRTSAFRCMTQWCHHSDVKPGASSRPYVCQSLGLLHFHETGFRRQVERSVRVLQSFPYVRVSDEHELFPFYTNSYKEESSMPMGEILDRLHQAAKARRAAVPCGHKVEYYDVLLRRRATIRAFRDMLNRLPTIQELDEYAQRDQDMAHGGPAAAIHRAIRNSALSVYDETAAPPSHDARFAKDDDWNKLLFWDGGLAQGVSIRQTSRKDKQTFVILQVQSFFSNRFDVSNNASNNASKEKNTQLLRPSSTAQKLPTEQEAVKITSMKELVTFEDALLQYASNHNDTGTDKTTSHAYGPLYSQVFAPLRERAKRVLEIGVYSGASVLAMADFFQNAKVMGIDITLDNIKFAKDHPRVSFRLLDGTRPDTPRILGGTWDIILDDASHRYEDQLNSFEIFAPFMRQGGVYIIEDIDGRVEAQLNGLKEGLQTVATRFGFQKFEWHDLREQKGQFDDIVAVIYK